MRKEYDRRKKWYRSILSLCLVVALVSSSILPQIQNTYVVQAQEESTLQDSGAADVSAENSVSQTSQEEQTAEPEKAANILEYQDTENGWSLTITGKNDFSEGQTAFIDGIDDPDKVENYITSLNKDVFAIDKKKVTDYKFPVDISILDQEGKAVENFGEATVRMERSDCHELDGYELYHLIQNPESEEDGQWEKIDFKTYDATETESSYVEFSVKSFSPFVWVKTEVIEEETVESDDTESDNTEEPSALAATTEEENSDEENIATTADEQQLYAILYENGNLHFQYGDTPDSSKGNVVKTYLVKDSYATPNQIPWYAERNSIVSVTSDSVVGTGSMRAWFYGCSHLTKVDLSNFDTSNVTNMEKMFYECSALTELDVSNFNTSNVTDMGYMFDGCRSLTELDVSNFDTSNVTNMNNMFYGCRTLTELDVSKFNTSKITGIYYMFYSCSKLKKLDVSNFDTSNFTKLFGMFGYCEALTELDVSNFNTSNVTDMGYMFCSCSSLIELDVSNFNTSNVTEMYRMFDGCSALTELDVSNFNTSNVTDMGYMFCSCSSLIELDVSNFNTSNVTEMYRMFDGCSALTELDVSNFNTSNVTDMDGMFYDCRHLTELDVSKFDTSNVTKINSMFNSCGALAELDVSNFNTSNVTDMDYMFRSCGSLTELDVSKFDTSNVTDMDYMFDGCSALTELDVSKFDTGNVTKMNNMFDGCRSLTELNLSNFDTSNVTNMTYMFYKCTSLREIVLGKKWKFYGSTDYLPVAEWMNKSTREIYPSLWTQYDGSTMAGVYITKFICKFDANGGMWDKTIECYSNYRLGSDVVISDPVRLGYVFAGWYDAQTGGVKLNENDCVEKDIYYAHWIPNNYKLILRSNGTKEPDIEISMKYDSFYQLSEDLFHREGYVLSGWNDRRNGSGKSYPANESVGNLESVENGEYILYAQWTKESKYATISFETDGGSAVNSYKVLKGSELGEVPTTSKENYTFINWHLNSLEGAVPDKTTVINEDVILHAEFMKDPIVTFVSGIGTDKQRRVKYNQKVGTLPVCGQNDNRYKTFGGWFTEENGGGTQVTKDTIVTMDVTYYAYWGWAPKFRTNGGRIVSSPYPEGYPLKNDSSYIIDKLPEVVREGYTFKGWFLGDGTTAVQEGDTVDLSKGIEINAKWEIAGTHTVILNENKQNGSKKEIKIYQGEKLSGLYEPVNSGYKFTGWMAEDSIYYKNGDPVTSDLALSAQWKKNNVTVTFNPKSSVGTGTMNSKTKTIPAGTSLNTIPGARLANYYLEGWYTQEDGKGTKLTKDTVINESVTYYANYEPVLKKYTSEEFSYTFGAEWTNANNSYVDNYNNNLEWHYTGSKYNSFVSTLHLRYELNQSVGTSVLPAGAVQIKVPKYIWKDWEGEWTGTNNVSSSIPRYPSTSSGMYFSYIDGNDKDNYTFLQDIEDAGNYYYLINNQPISGGTGLDFTISYSAYAYKIPGGAMDYDDGTMDYINGYDYYQGNVPVTVNVDTDFDITNADAVYRSDMKDEVILTDEMHTYRSPKASLLRNDVYYSWQDSWGEKPLDAEDYFYVAWTWRAQVDGNAPFSAVWSEDTVHEGTVVGWTTSSSGLTEEDSVKVVNETETDYWNSTVVMKYPRSLLVDIPQFGLVLSNTAVLKTTWKSEYEQERLAEGTVTIHDAEYPRGEFDKRNDGSNSQVGNVRKIYGGNEDLVYDNKEVSMGWTVSYNGTSRSSAVTWDEDSRTYQAAKRVIELMDGKSGDVMYSSGRPAAKYVWEPNTGNVALYDNDYYIRQLEIYLSESDAECNEGVWVETGTHGNTSDYEGIDIYVRYANTDRWVYFKTVSVNDKGNSNVTLPDGVAGYKVQHGSEFYRTSLSVRGVFQIKPTDHIKSLVSADMTLNTTSIFKDQSECSIWEKGKEGTAFFHATNNLGGNNPADRVVYELDDSQYYQSTEKSADGQSTVVADAVNGVQDNKMTLVSWNYNTSGRKTPMTSGVFYDLLPAGTTVNVDTVDGYYITANTWEKPTSGMTLKEELYHVRFEENWEGSNRTMMVIECNAPGDVKVTGFMFTYMLRNTYKNIVEKGTTVENDVAFVNTTSTRTTPNAKSGVLNTITEQKYYQSLDVENKDFITYAKASTDYIPVDAYSWGFDKSVKSASTDNAYVKKDAVTSPKGEYTYRLEYSQSDNAKASNLVFYDILEQGADRINDGKTEFVRSGWHGTFKSVDVAAIAEKYSNGSTSVKCNPIVYYSTKDRDSFTGEDYNINNSATWSLFQPSDLSKVTAIAIDCSKATDGSRFVFKNKDSLAVYVTMTAPDDSNGFDKIAYNTAAVYTTQGDSNITTSLTSDSEITLKDLTPELHKTSDPASGTSEEPTKVFIDTSLNYKLSIRNTSSELPMENIVVEDTVPKELVLDYDNIKFALDDSEGVLASESPRISVEKEGRKLTFTIKRLAAGQTGHILIPTVVNVESGRIENTSKITKVNGIEKEITSETTYHEVVPSPEENPKVKVRKVNHEGVLLGGATLQITGRGIYDSEDIDPIQWVTEENKVFEVALEPGSYVLHEVSAPEGYVTNEDIAFEVKDTDVELEMFDSEKTTLQINKDWNDGEDVNGRPDSIDFEIYQDGKYLKGVTVKKSDNWKLTVEDLPKYSNEGTHEQCKYTVKEKSDKYSAGYTYGTDMDQQSVDVVNTKLTTVKGEKVWDDNDDPSRPDAIMVRLLQNGVEYLTQTVNEEADWKYEFSGIPKYDADGKEYVYSVKEAPVDGYSVSYTKKPCKGLAVTIQYQTEYSYDWFYVYYYKDGKLYRSDKYSGSSLKTATLNIPSTEFWLEFRSDVSDCDYYGVKVMNVQQLDTEPAILGNTGYPMPKGYTEIEAVDWREIETLHTSYGNNVQKRWHYASEAGDTIITNTKITTENPTKVQFAKVDEKGKYVVNAQLQLIDSKGNIVQDWITENAPEEFEGITPGEYTLHEVSAPDGYKLAEDMKVTITETTEVQTFTMVDKLDKKVNLSVAKTVTGSGGNKSKEFNFNLQLTGSDSYPEELSYIVTEKGQEDVNGTMPLNGGAGKFTLSHGQTITFTEVPSGLQYEVHEMDGESQGYTVTYTNEKGTLENDVAVTVENNKQISVPTLADTNNKVILLLAGIAIVAGLLMIRRRKE